MKAKYWTVRVEMVAGNFYIYDKIKAFSKFDAEKQAMNLNHVELSYGKHLEMEDYPG